MTYEPKPAELLDAKHDDPDPTGPLTDYEPERATAAAATPRPWPAQAQPTAQQLADWLGVCTDAERLAFAEHALRTQEEANECFIRDHERRIESEIHRRVVEQEAVHNDLRAIMHALGIGDHARPFSSHEVVLNEVIPAIYRAREKATT